MNTDGPTLELSPDDSQRLFEMIAGGAKPADIFETFDPTNAHYHIKGGMVVHDITDQTSLIARVIKALGGELPKIDPPSAANQLPPGMDPNGIEAKLLAKTVPPAIACISLGRKGEKRGFGFDKAVTYDASNGEFLPDSDGIASDVVGIDPNGIASDVVSSTPVPEAMKNLPQVVKDQLVAKLARELNVQIGATGSSGGGGEQHEGGTTIRIGKISIKGGEGAGVNIEMEGVEMSGPDHTKEFLDAFVNGGGDKS